MSPYQNERGFATCGTGNPLHRLWFLLLAVPLLLPLATPTQAAQPRSEDPGLAHVFLLPADDAQVRLLTHTVDIFLEVTEDGRAVLQVEARYRLHNPDREPRDVVLDVVARVDPESPGSSLPVDLTVASEDGPTHPLTIGPDGTPQATIRLEGDERRMVLVRYTLPLPDDELVTVRYPMAVLESWPTAPNSWRVSIYLPEPPREILPNESWLRLSPTDWRYDGRQIYWMSEAAIPHDPFLFQAVHPRTWQEVTRLRAVLQAEPSLDAAQRLAEHYQRLYTHPALDPSARERFYAQALAAYSDALTLAEELDIQGLPRAELHRARAELYRRRAVTPAGQVDEAYLDLMLAEVEAALETLPPGEPALQAELGRWQAEALRLKLAQARNRQDWATALALLAQMEALPPGLVDPKWLETARQDAVLQQALLLLERGDLQASLALAGPLISTQELVPLEARALFAPWQATLEVAPEQTRLALTTAILPGREAEAAQLLERLQQAWQAISTPQLPTLSRDGDRVRIELTTTRLRQRLDLAQAIPPSAHWALLRTLLVQSDPRVERETRGIWRRTRLALEVDLRPVADQWNALAQRLEQEADQAEAATQNTPEPGEQLRLRLQALYRRQEASRWQRLAQESQAQITLLPDPDAPSRTWILGPEDGTRTLDHQVEQAHTPQLVLLALGLMAAVGIVAGILWLLL